LSSPYQLQESDSYSYEFTTDFKVKYHIYFIDYAYMFYDYEHITCPFYSFNIDVIDGSTRGVAEDVRIRQTVLHVFQLFFEKVDNVAIYVCDSLDERQLARKRKFDLWFSSFKNEMVIKLDGVATVEGVSIYNAILVHRNNKEVTEIESAFNDLNKIASDK